MKKNLINIGRVIAILLMFSPFIILSQFKILETFDFFVLLIASILYDIYLYSILSQQSSMSDAKVHYYKYIKNSDKKLNLKITHKEKYDNLEEYVEQLLEKYF